MILIEHDYYRTILHFGNFTEIKFFLILVLKNNFLVSQ